jgi:uncharacterized protein
MRYLRSLFMSIKFKGFLLTVLLFTCTSLVASPFNAPKYQGYVTDPTKVLSTSQKQTLEALSKKLEARTGAQVATAIIPEMGDSMTIEGFASQLFEKWGIGQKGKDNGVLFLISLKERKMRIEVGYGLEGLITDGKSGAILDEFVVPYFKAGRIQDGIISVHYALASVIADANDVQLIPQQTRQSRAATGHQGQQQSSPLQNMMVLIILGLVIFGMIKSPTFRAFMFGMIVASMFSRGRGSSSGHFGSGGGFGGFGGGMSGGGGASRGW